MKKSRSGSLGDLALLLLEAAPKSPGSAAGDICSREMVWHGRVAWLPWALLLLWVPGEGLGRQLGWVGGWGGREGQGCRGGGGPPDL